jgi:hypothetical protein
MTTSEQNSDRAHATADTINRAESGFRVQEGGFGKVPRQGAKKNMSPALCLATFVMAVALPLGAQQPTPTPAASDKNVTSEQVNDANIQLMRQDIRAQRKKIIAANMPLTETEATRFWPLYDRYAGEIIKINDARYALLKEYAQSYSNMTDDQADSFIKSWVGFDRDTTELRLKYIPEFETVISHKKTALFFQIDRRLSMLVELQLASQVPLVQP